MKSLLRKKQRCQMIIGPMATTWRAMLMLMLLAVVRRLWNDSRKNALDF